MPRWQNQILTTFPHITALKGWVNVGTSGRGMVSGGQYRLSPTPALIAQTAKSLVETGKQATIIKFPGQVFTPDYFPFNQTFVPLLGMLAIGVKNWLKAHNQLTPEQFPQVQFQDKSVFRSVGSSALNTHILDDFHVDGITQNKDNKLFNTKMAALFLGYGPQKNMPVNTGNLQLFNAQKFVNQTGFTEDILKIPPCGGLPAAAPQVLSNPLFKQSVITLPRTHAHDTFLALFNNSPSLIWHRGNKPIPQGGWREWVRFHLGYGHNPPQSHTKTIQRF